MNKNQQTHHPRNNYEKRKKTFQYSRDIQGYKQAVWDFMLEHSDVQESGAMFIKFHTSGKDNFQKRVFARWQYGYHRENVTEKDQKQIDLRTEYTQRKIDKEVRWETYKQERKRHYQRQIRKEKIKAYLRPLLRIVRALLPRGKKDSETVLPKQER